MGYMPDKGYIDKYLKIVPAPISEHRDYNPMITIPASEHEIIRYLEEKCRLLESTLDKLKQYCGSDYIEAARELEVFLNNSGFATYREEYIGEKYE